MADVFIPRPPDMPIVGDDHHVDPHQLNGTIRLPDPTEIGPTGGRRARHDVTDEQVLRCSSLGRHDPPRPGDGKRLPDDSTPRPDRPVSAVGLSAYVDGRASLRIVGREQPDVFVGRESSALLRRAVGARRSCLWRRGEKTQPTDHNRERCQNLPTISNSGIRVISHPSPRSMILHPVRGGAHGTEIRTPAAQFSNSKSCSRAATRDPDPGTFLGDERSLLKGGPVDHRRPVGPSPCVRRCRVLRAIPITRVAPDLDGPPSGAWNLRRRDDDDETGPLRGDRDQLQEPARLQLRAEAGRWSPTLTASPRKRCCVCRAGGEALVRGEWVEFEELRQGALAQFDQRYGGTGERRVRGGPLGRRRALTRNDPGTRAGARTSPLREVAASRPRRSPGIRAGSEKLGTRWRASPGPTL
jgi:hypothetical protein